MKARVNTFALQQSCLQSSALGVLGSIAHPIGKPGEFTGRVMQGRVQVAEFSLHADPDVAATQATIDLARIAGPSLVGQPYKVHKYSVNSDGYLMLFVSEGPGEFWVQLSSPGKDRPRVVFDSRRLKPGDLFIATLIRPGTHQARMPKGVAAIRVRAPEASDHRFQPPPAGRHDLHENRICPQEAGGLFDPGNRLQFRDYLRRPDRFDQACRDQRREVAQVRAVARPAGQPALILPPSE